MKNTFSKKADVRKILISVLGVDVLEIQNVAGNLYLQVKSDSVLRCLTILATHSETMFVSLMDCFAVDSIKRKNECEIYYQLHSYKLNKTIFVITNVYKNAEMQSMVPLFPNANWHECEIYEMNGITFKNHPGLQKILNING